MIVLFPALLIVRSAGAEPPEGYFALVDDQQQAVVVGDFQIPKAPQLGFRFSKPRALVDYIRQSTGRQLRAIPESAYRADRHKLPIFVGDTAKARELFADDLAALDQDGYIVHVTPDFVVLTANSDHALAWAQFDFLRTYLGIDTYLPAAIGTIVPKHKQVRIKPETRIEQPVFRSRSFSAINSTRGIRAQTQIPWRLHARYHFHHYIHKFVRVDEFGKSHPEFFAQKNGKRVIVSSHHAGTPCTSNPALVEIITKKVQAHFDEHPEQDTVSLGMTDGGWCECDACKALDGPSLEVAGRTSPRSRRYFTFLNQVAGALRQSHPGKSIGVLGYMGADLPPAFEVQPNIIPYICFNRMNWSDPKTRESDLAIHDAWLDRVDRIGTYEYLYGTGYSIPRLYLHDLAAFLRHLADRSEAPGFYAEMYANHGLDGPKAWIVEKLIWNPHQDVDALLGQWCRAMFTESAEPMRAYFSALEVLRKKNAHRVGSHNDRFFLFFEDQQFELFLPKDMDVLWSHLEEAKRLAVTDQTRERIAYFVSTFRITDALVRQYHGYKPILAMMDAGDDSQQVLARFVAADETVPDLDVASYIKELKRNDSTKFMDGPVVNTPARIMRWAIDHTAWAAVRAGLQAKQVSVTDLTNRAASALDTALAGISDTSRRGSQLRALARRMVTAPRLDEQPVIDGNVSDPCWQWRQDPWWCNYQSGQPVDNPVRFAFAYDDTHLYVAIQCDQGALPDRERVEGYGAPAWRYAGIELFVNRDVPELGRKDYYQAVIALGGGFYENHPAMRSFKMTDDGQRTYSFELAVAWKDMGIDPQQDRALRMNIARNVKEARDRERVAWYLSLDGHRGVNNRGWLLLE